MTSQREEGGNARVRHRFSINIWRDTISANCFLTPGAALVTQNQFGVSRALQWSVFFGLRCAVPAHD